MIDQSIFNRILTPELLELKRIFDKYSYELRIAGGAVRDLVMKKIPEDIDFATTATPHQMLVMFEKENIRMFNNNGIKHGTVSVRINDKENFEITTLRIDVKTFGRHAEVQFTTDWMIDANRRDLTINSLFLDLNGQIYDYFNGLEHIDKRKVLFVGDANIRIEEDYLRILRYFRFFALMGSKVHNQQIVEVIANHVDGLSGVSGERIWTEIRKIAVGPNAPQILETMAQCGVLRYIGLSSVHEDQLNEFKMIYDRSIELQPFPVTLMCALFKDDFDLSNFHKRVRLSNDENDIALMILHYRKPANRLTGLKSYLDIAVEMDARNHSKIKEKLSELIKYNAASTQCAALLTELNEFDIPKFPVSGLELAAFGIKRGPNFGRILNTMRSKWKASNFQLSREQLMSDIDKIVESLKSEDTDCAVVQEKHTAIAVDDFILAAKKRRKVLSK